MILTHFYFLKPKIWFPEFKKQSNGNFEVDDDGNYLINEKDSFDDSHTIRYYKPRIEGLFARIERWKSKTSGEIKWRIITKGQM